MEEIKVGDYIRVNGIIGKVEQTGNSLFWLEDGSSYSLFDKKVKHSKNIIDLIECGDYVNGELVTGIYDIVNNNYESIGKKITTKYRTAQFTGLDINYCIYAEDIKTILTHEQFEQNSYKV